MNTELSMHADDCECRTCIAHQIVARGSRLADQIYDNTNIVDALKPVKHECVILKFPIERRFLHGER